MDTSPRLRVGVAALTLAVFAGIAETLITVIGFLLAAELPSAWPIQVGTRLVVYTGLLVLLALTWRGRRAARWAVLILLGVVGLGSLVVPLVTELIAGSGLIAALGGEASPWFAIVRAAHILLVLIGSVALLAHRPPPTPGVDDTKRIDNYVSTY